MCTFGAQHRARCGFKDAGGRIGASHNKGLLSRVRKIFSTDTFGVFETPDVLGVELGGSIKNVIAISAGIVEGLGLGSNTRAVLFARGVAEMARLGLAMGAKRETFMGLSGLGDLVLTATGDLSRNRRVGLALGQGQTLAQATAALGHVAEGVYSARTVVQRAGLLGVSMPIAEAVVALRNAIDGAGIDLIEDISLQLGPLGRPFRGLAGAAIGLIGRMREDFEMLRSSLIAPAVKDANAQGARIAALETEVKQLRKASRRGGVA